MRRHPKDFSTEERAEIMAAVRRGAEVGRSVGLSARAWGITEATYYRWVRDESRRAAAVPSAQDTDHGGLANGYVPAVGQAAALAPTRPRRRGPLPVAERRDLQDRALALTRRGIPVGVVAERLAVSERTVQRWVAPILPGAGFVEVEVVTDRAPAPVSPVLHAPGGYRVEGLDIAGLAELLRRLA